MSRTGFALCCSAMLADVREVPTLDVRLPTDHLNEACECELLMDERGEDVSLAFVALEALCSSGAAEAYVKREGMVCVGVRCLR